MSERAKSRSTLDPKRSSLDRAGLSAAQDSDSPKNNAQNSLEQRVKQFLSDAKDALYLVPLQPEGRDDPTLYSYGQTKINLAMVSGQLVCRVGGGFQTMYEWLLKHYAPAIRRAFKGPDIPDSQVALLVELEGRILGLCAQVVDLKAARQAALDSLAASEAHWREQLDQALAARDEVLSQLRAEQQATAEARAAAERANAENQQARQEIDALLQLVESQKQEIANLESRLSSAENENKNLAELNAQKARLIEELNNEIAEITRSKEILELSLKDESKAMQQLRAAYDAVFSEKQRLVEQVIPDLEAQLAAAHDLGRQQKAQMEDMERQFRTLSDEMSKLNSERSELLSENDKLRKDLTMAKEIIDELFENEHMAAEIKEFEEHVMSISLESVENCKDAEERPIAEKVKEFLLSKQGKLVSSLVRIGKGGTYRVGTRPFTLALVNEILLVRVGGGYQAFPAFWESNARFEGEMYWMEWRKNRPNRNRLTFSWEVDLTKPAPGSQHEEPKAETVPISSPPGLRRSLTGGNRRSVSRPGRSRGELNLNYPNSPDNKSSELKSGDSKTSIKPSPRGETVAVTKMQSGSYKTVVTTGFRGKLASRPQTGQVYYRDPMTGQKKQMAVKSSAEQQ